jgi:hypothetical protein
MNQILLTSLALSLLLTIIFEIVFFLLVGKKDKKDLLLLVLVNIFTNPVVVLSYYITVTYTDWNPSVIKIPLELFAIITEGYYYKKYGRNFRHPYLFSAAANMFSFWIGVIIQIFM